MAPSRRDAYPLRREPPHHDSVLARRILWDEVGIPAVTSEPCRQPVLAIRFVPRPDYAAVPSPPRAAPAFMSLRGVSCRGDPHFVAMSSMPPLSEGRGSSCRSRGSPRTRMPSRVSIKHRAYDRPSIIPKRTGGGRRARPWRAFCARRDPRHARGVHTKYRRCQ